MAPLLWALGAEGEGEEMTTEGQSLEPSTPELSRHSRAS